MEAKAYLYDVRIAPRKVQIVLDLIRGKDVEMAAAIGIVILVIVFTLNLISRLISKKFSKANY